MKNGLRGSPQSGTGGSPHLSCGSFFAVFEDEDEPSPLNFAAPRNEDEEE
ncbi:MAG: hypothetical protein ABSC89_06020 [Verrucomicrobiota bacterium]|jgi:hypothetical protein